MIRNRIITLFISIPFIIQSQGIVGFGDVRINEDCAGTHILHSLPYDYLGGISGHITFRGSNNSSLKLYEADTEILQNESFVIPGDKIADVNFSFNIDENLETSSIYFSQKIDNVTWRDTVEIYKGQFHFNENESHIKISDSCQDSVIVHLPFGGTQTSTTVWKKVNGKFEEVVNTYYMCCYWENYIKVPTHLKHTYKIRYSGCHSPNKTFTNLLH